MAASSAIYDGLSAHESHALYIEEVAALETIASKLEDDLSRIDKQSDHSAYKAGRRAMYEAKEKISIYTKTADPIIAQKVMDELWAFESEKTETDSVLSDDQAEIVRQLYLIMTKHGRLNSRYIKLPRNWMCLGYQCGFLEDLVVVMRTLGQLKISLTHMVGLTDLVTGFLTYLAREAEKDDDNPPRFSFLTNVLTNRLKGDRPAMRAFFRNAIEAQGASMRIGVWSDLSDQSDDADDYYYAIQGMYSLEFDPRVTRSIKSVDYSEDYAGDPDIAPPKYGIHFTVARTAIPIYRGEDTTCHRRRKNGKPILPGHICRFDRVIHAISDLSPVDPDDLDQGFKIAPKLKDIRSRMTHGISDEVTRQKYEAGLIFNVQKLVAHFEAQGLEDQVLLNEINTLLIQDDIPPDCIIGLISTPEELDAFWLG
jgi:hypothetical protein